MNYVQQLLLSLIRYETEDINVEEELLSKLDGDALFLLYKLSLEQDVAYIVASALSRLGVLDGEAKEAFFNEQLSAIYKTQLFIHELEQITETFEKNSICHIPLKGAIIRELYPKPEMRSSCDTDILIKREDLLKAEQILTEELSYKKIHSSGHDIGFMSPGGAELELHFRLYENKGDKKDILDKVWQYSYPCDGYQYRYNMQPEFFMFYHLFHMFKHLKNGGCGVRPFLDLWILENKMPYDKQKLNKLLDICGFNKFASAVTKTSGVWYGTEQENEVTSMLAEYIFNAGIYGTFENLVAFSVAQKGGKVREFLSRVFQSRDFLKNQYPILEDKPYLTPYYQVKRWHRIIFKDKSGVQIKIAKQNLNLTDEKRQKAEKLIKELGLK